MDELTQPDHSPLFDQANKMVRVQGIISIVFGSLSAVSLFIFIALFGIIALSSGSSRVSPPDSDSLVFVVVVVISIVLSFAMNIYSIIAGIVLLRTPKPRTVRLLTIINIVVGVLSSIIITAFAIVSLVQFKDYLQGYKQES